VGATDKNITWTKQGTIGNVSIYADYGAGYLPTPIATVDAEAVALFNWTPIPDQVSNTVKIKVQDASDATVYDESDAVFHIVGSITITAPNGAPLTSGIRTTSDGPRRAVISAKSRSSSTTEPIGRPSPNRRLIHRAPTPMAGPCPQRQLLPVQGPYHLVRPGPAGDCQDFRQLWIHGGITVTARLPGFSGR